ncbi:MAG: hypothetical protein RJA22_2378 [Verrucomicrobiota bacterium]|jgi:putative heme-binding domain-containing protein
MRQRNVIRIAALVLLGSLTLPVASRAQAEDPLPALVEVLGTSDDPQFHLDILKGMADGLKGRRSVPMPAGWEAAAARLARSTNPEVRALVQSLSVTFGSAGALEAHRRTLTDSKAPAADRVAALDSLLGARAPGLAAPLQSLLADPALRGPAVRALASFDDARTPAAILAAYGTLTPAERKDALNTLAARASFARALLQAVAAQQVPARDLGAELVRQLRRFQDPDLNAQVVRLWGTVRDRGADAVRETERYRKLITSGPAGDARQGRAVFARVCQGCHVLFDTGGKVGPDITGSARSDLDYILQNILEPNAVIPNEYQTWNLETKDDRVITGIVKRQDDNAVTIVTANETLVIPRGEIASLAQGTLSMMPEGLLQPLTDDEVRHLIAYLKSPAQVPLPR